MKTTLKLVIVIAFVAICGNVSAQNIKLAYINFQELIASMPESDSAQVKMQKVGQELEKTMEEMQVELNRKQDEFQKNQTTWTDLVKQSKTEELTSMYQRLQTFQQNANESYQQEYQKLLQPIQDKASKAIDAVSKEQNITMVFDSQVLHYKALGTLDLLPAVKQYLGIKK